MKKRWGAYGVTCALAITVGALMGLSGKGMVTLVLQLLVQLGGVAAAYFLCIARRE